MKTNFVFLFIIILMIIIGIPFNKLNAGSISTKNPDIKAETINFTVLVMDKGAAIPLQSVDVLLKEGNSIIAKSSTNAFGRAFFKDIGSGHYKIAAYFIGYNDFNDSVTVDSLHQTFLVKLVEKTTQLKEIVIEGETVNKVATTINIESGQQIFE